MKSIIFGTHSILTGTNDVVMTGGFESMSNIPYYLPKARNGYAYGNGEVLDGVLKDGLWDAFDDHHMGNCAEVCAAKYGLTREQQDNYAIESYRRANLAIKDGLFKEEMITIPELDIDERPGSLKLDKVRTLKPAFQKDGGTVTAANASSLNDGAAALVLASGAWAQGRGLKPLARIIGWGDAQQAPVWFTTAPALAIPIALDRAGLTIKDVDYWEINEAFSAVALANNHLLGLDPTKVNVNGGAVALGHPIGGSGARIVVTLLHVLQQRKARIGVAAICNGGGGASCVVVENLKF
jgi:acetyl-CoA C-acetyltransferase